MKNVIDDLSGVSESIPYNTYGVGTGISVIYHLLGWDNYEHVTDFSGLTVAGDDAIYLIVDEIL